MNRKTFFATLRRRDSELFGTSLSQRQVDGMEALLDAGAGLPLPHMANVLAQTHRETGGGMYPIKETVLPHHRNKNPSDAEVIRRLDRAFAKGQLSWVSKPYWRDGAFGRGGIQITHDYNYKKFGIRNYSDALKLKVSARISVQGLRDGLFTGKKLADYDGAKYDHAGARSIVNGDGRKRDKGSPLTVSQIIARNGKQFERALEKSGWREGRIPPPPDVEPVRPQPRPRGFMLRIKRWLQGN